MRLQLVLATGLFLAVGGEAQQPQSLSRMTPSATVSRPLDREGKPQAGSRQTFHGKTGDALRMFSDSDVSYAIPSGAVNFVGGIAFNDFRSFEPESAGALARLLLRFLVDGKPVASVALDHRTPLRRFSVPVSGGHTLTVTSEGEFAADFYLVDASFSGDQKVNAAYVLAPGEGYVCVASEPRQTMYHAYYPNENVTVTVASGSPISSADLQLHLTPERTGLPAADFHTTVPLRPNSDGTYEGTTSWKVPAQKGPAQLEITAQASGRMIYQEKRRIAIIAQTDLASIPNSYFGVHTSTAGYLVPQDEFASIWGAKWARVFVRWPIIERQQGNYDFSYIEPVLDAYRKQNIRVLAVLGENAPSWAGPVGPQHYAAWKKWVAETVRRLQPKVDAWDLFNEIDVKYYGTWRTVDPNADLTILKNGIDAIRSVSSTAKIVCCSTGTYGWLIYDKRLSDAGILKQIDIVSLHPYMQYAPEEKDPVFSYPEKLTQLEELIRPYGQSKSHWATEAAWIRGPQGDRDVTAADIDEHTQAQYTVRVNLLTAVRTVPYFSHMPMNHYHHLQLQLDTLSGFANVTSLLSTATAGARTLLNAPGVWAFAWNTKAGVVGALWTERGKANVGISGVTGAQFLDMYGNRIDVQPAEVSLSTDPIYFVASAGASPKVDLKSGPAVEQWTALPALTSWQRVNTSQYSEIPGGLHVVSQPTTYGYQLVSPAVPVRPNTCYLGRLDFRLNRGAIAFIPQDASKSKSLGEGYHFTLLALPNSSAQQAIIRFNSGDATQAKFLIIGSNQYSAEVSDFSVSSPAISPCPN